MKTGLGEKLNGRFNGLSGNQLKIIALISMTIDHIGLYLFPQYMIFRYIGRIAFPIFAYMIAEGCLYTKNRKRYLASVAGVGIVCQAVYSAVTGSLYQNIFITFVLSIGLIYLLDNVAKKGTKASVAVFFIFLVTVAVICIFLPDWLSGTDFCIDYGFVGVMLPVLVYSANTKRKKLIFTGIMLIMLIITLGKWQIFNLLSLPLIAMYNGKRGKHKMKNLFYIYYPLHLVGIYLISAVLN